MNGVDNLSSTSWNEGELHRSAYASAVGISAALSAKHCGGFCNEDAVIVPTQQPPLLLSSEYAAAFLASPPLRTPTEMPQKLNETMIASQQLEKSSAYVSTSSVCVSTKAEWGKEQDQPLPAFVHAKDKLAPLLDGMKSNLESLGLVGESTPSLINTNVKEGVKRIYRGDMNLTEAEIDKEWNLKEYRTANGDLMLGFDGWKPCIVLVPDVTPLNDEHLALASHNEPDFVLNIRDVKKHAKKQHTQHSCGITKQSKNNYYLDPTWGKIAEGASVVDGSVKLDPSKRSWTSPRRKVTIVKFYHPTFGKSRSVKIPNGWELKHATDRGGWVLSKMRQSRSGILSRFLGPKMSSPRQLPEE